MDTYSLDQSPLYRLSSRKRLAERVFGLSLPVLENLVANEALNYVASTPTTGGKQRTVQSPKPLLRRVQQRLAHLLSRIDQPEYLHSGRKGRSYISNALVHDASNRLVKLDLRKFYPSITCDRIWRFFGRDMQCSPDVSALLARIATFEGSAPIGSPVSQILAFRVLRPLLDEAHLLARQHHLAFSCYVDDLCFSGKAATPGFLWKVKQIVHRHGYRYHAAACYGPDADKLVTGVRLTQHGTRVSLQLARKLAIAQHEFDTVSNPASKAEALARLIGRTAAAAAVDSRFIHSLHSLVRQQRARGEILRA